MSLFMGFGSRFLSPVVALRNWVVVAGLASGLLGSQLTFAAETEDTEESVESATEDGSSNDSAAAEEAPSGDEEEVADASAKGESDRPSSPPKTEANDSVWEDPAQRYLFVGARYRIQYVPLFLQNLFADGGEGLWVHTPGVEFGMRKDGFETSIFAMLGMYSMDSVPFKGKTDPELAWELIDANYKVLFLGADFMWSSAEFAKGLSLVYGAGIGLGVVFGDMNRTQSYADPNSSNGFTKCNGPFDPAGLSAAGQYCDMANNHYNGYVEPSWANDGSSPLVFPWLGGQLGLRYKAHRRFVGRVELGFTITSLFFGIGADFGL